MATNNKQRPGGKFREAMESGTEDDGYEPQELWLIPIYLRSRIQFYDEVKKKVASDIEEMKRHFDRRFPSRSARDDERLGDIAWIEQKPLWWGLDDIVGWIDVRACVRTREIQAALFLPTKRVSRQLKDKRYVMKRMESLPVDTRTTNAELQEAVVKLVENVAADHQAKNRYIDLEQWKILVLHTDIASIIREAAQKDYDRLKEEGRS